MSSEQLVTPEINELLAKIYYDPANEGSYSNAQSLHNAIKSTQPIVSLNTVRQWLQSQPTYTLHRPSRRRFARRRFIVHRMDEQWQMDIGFVVGLSRWNSGVKYLLYVIDVLSKFLWVEPMHDKTAKSTAAAFKAILNRAAPRKPETIFSDLGSEFIGREFKQLLINERIRQFTATNSATKAAIAERVIRTFMTALARHIRAHGNRYLPVLQALTDRYNKRYHRAIKTAPINVTKENQGLIWEQLYDRGADCSTASRLLTGRYYKYPVGALVRIVISRVGVHFYKGYQQSWSSDIFIVSKQLPTSDKPTYRVSDPITGREIDGTYYEAELQLVAPSNKFANVIEPSQQTVAENIPEAVESRPEKLTRSGKTYG